MWEPLDQSRFMGTGLSSSSLGLYPNPKQAPTQTSGLREGRVGPSPETHRFTDQLVHER